MRQISLRVVLCLVVAAPGAAAQEATPAEGPRFFGIEDALRLGEVEDPRISPDGRWVAYTVTLWDTDEDEKRSRVWMVPAAGGEAVAMTDAKSSASRPRWSPDGKYLSFLAARDEGKTQVWTLFREGGDSVQLTDTAQDVEAYEWSPDGRRLVLVLRDPTPREEEAAAKRAAGESVEEKTPPPWVVTRRQFKLDYVGYLDSRRTHLYVFDVATREMRQLTFGDFDDSAPAWSPDGTRLAFVSNRSEAPDADYNSDVWTVAADGSEEAPTRVTSNPGPDVAPAWSPDGRRIAHLSATDTEAILYATNHLAVSSTTGGETRVLTLELDRNVLSPRFSAAGDEILFIIEESGQQTLAALPPDGGAIERRIGGPRVVGAFDPGPEGRIAALIGEPHLPAEVFVQGEGELVRLTRTNDEVLAGLELGAVEEVRFRSPDGTGIEGFAVKPPGFEAGRRYPAVLWIHGGPMAQYDFSFDVRAQILAGAGYLVILPNPRGSTGYGQEFCLAIWRDWGGPDLEDVLAAVDDAVARGWADPERLGVGGWSYGGMLTNHVITRTDRFAAAVTGASAALYVVNYGHDQYQRWWEYELGLPWEAESREIWEELSPFNRVESIVTPTLIVGGEKDWNVPIINSEQLFLALKRLGRTTELVVYPGEFHGIGKPSYVKDLYERYVAWYEKYLGGGGEAPDAPAPSGDAAK